MKTLPRSLFALLVVLTALTVYRGWVIAHQPLPLYVDEAQYWTWSLAPDWGYYSKPPMVAWVIRLFSWMGDSELAVRAGTLLLHPLTAMLVYLLGVRMFGTSTAIAAAILFITLPLVGFNSLFMTTDAPLFFFWAWASLALWDALEHDRLRDWISLGVAAGLGLLSKYSMAVFAPSVVLLLMLPPYRAQWRRYWRNPRLYLAALIALIVFSPNLWWNMQMDFVSFRHTAEISQLDRNLFHPARLAEFLAGQVGCMGPIAFVFLVAAIASRQTWRDRRLAFLAALTVPFLAVISLQALLAKANANWAAPAYFGGSLLVAARLDATGGRRWWWAIVILNLVLLSLFYHYRTLAEAAGITLTHRRDPYARVAGWPQAGQEVGKALARFPGARLAVVDRGEFALLRYYVRPHPEGMRIWNPKGGRHNHFHLVADMRGDVGADFLFATAHRLGDEPAASFEQWEMVDTIDIPLYPDYRLQLFLYRGVGFRGYAP